MMDAGELLEGLTKAMARAGFGPPAPLTRLTGGATMESWRFNIGGESFVLRRAPSLEFMSDRPFGHDVEGAIIRAAREAGVTAPEVIVNLTPDDGIGSGFVMRALPGTADPRKILEMDDPAQLLREAARDLARIHSLGRKDVPETVPVMDYHEAIADLRQQFLDAGGDRPIIALGLKWMEDNCPDQCDSVLTHGDYRMGNLLAEPGALTGVLDWEMAQFGDRHEDLAFGCMAVWRFHRYDRPALGLGSLEDYFAAYEAEAGVSVDRDRFRYWLVHRTVWWALGCLKMAHYWRSGEDRMLERVVISRRTSEQELDLLLLLEEDAPEEERTKSATTSAPQQPCGEATDADLAQAIYEWLGTVKDRFEGHDKFQYAVARNALGMISRYDAASITAAANADLVRDIEHGEASLATPGLLAKLRSSILASVAQDVPKYPALAVARKKWTGQN